MYMHKSRSSIDQTIIDNYRVNQKAKNQMYKIGQTDFLTMIMEFLCF